MTNFNQSKICNMLFLDIETVREYKTYDEFIALKNLENWKKVAAKHYADVLIDQTLKTDDEIYLTKAALYPEYGKIVSIAFGKIENGNEKKIYHSTQHNENDLLNKIAFTLSKYYEENPNTILCGHNIIEYDIPFIVKRMIKHGIKIPIILQNAIIGKPWEIKVIDTLREWKMSTNKFLSLDTIAEFLSIPSSKVGEINGATLGETYWNNQNEPSLLLNIAKYCKSDVSVVMDIALKLSTV